MGEILIFLSQMERRSSLVPAPSLSVTPRHGNLSIHGVSLVYQALNLLRNFVVVFFKIMFLCYNEEIP